MERGNRLTRRRMLQLTGVSMLGAGAVIAGAGCSSGGQANTAQSATESVKLKVYDPSGNVEITSTFANRLDTIEGKTIAFVGNGMWEEDRTFALLKDEMTANYPGVTIIGPENFPRHSDELTVKNNGLPEKMQELGVDAVVVGNAG